MRFFEKTKDGGKESTVDAFFLFEIKGLFSVALLRFNKGSRNNFHSHAFHAFTWFLKGDMEEHRILDGEVVKRKYKRSFLPKLTKRNNLHKVIANKTSWCFTVRGKWYKEWQEVDLGKDELITLSNGRKIEKVEKANLKDLVGYE